MPDPIFIVNLGQPGLGVHNILRAMVHKAFPECDCALLLTRREDGSKATGEPHLGLKGNVDGLQELKPGKNGVLFGGRSDGK